MLQFYPYLESSKIRRQTKGVWNLYPVGYSTFQLERRLAKNSLIRPENLETVLKRLSSVSINVRRAIPTDSWATGSVFSIVNEQTRAELSRWELVFVNRIIQKSRFFQRFDKLLKWWELRSFSVVEELDLTGSFLFFIKRIPSTGVAEVKTLRKQRKYDKLVIRFTFWKVQLIELSTRSYLFLSVLYQWNASLRITECLLVFCAGQQHLLFKVWEKQQYFSLYQHKWRCVWW